MIGDSGDEEPRAGGALDDSGEGTGPNLSDASGAVVGLAVALDALLKAGVPHMGLSAGDRPAADVNALAKIMACVQSVLASHLLAAEHAGALPFPSRGGMLASRYWSRSTAHAFSRSGELVKGHPELGTLWAGGRITLEHVDAIARYTHKLNPEHLAATVDTLLPMLTELTPAQITAFMKSVVISLNPPEDGDEEAQRAYDSRYLAFTEYKDVVLISGTLPAIDAQLLCNTIDALVAKLRAEGDGLTMGQRRADALIELASSAATTNNLPNIGGAPVAVTVVINTTDNTNCCDSQASPTETAAPAPAPAPGPEASTAVVGCGYTPTTAELGFLLCDATLYPVEVGSTNRLDPDQKAPNQGCAPTGCHQRPTGWQARLNLLAADVRDRPIPLNLGRGNRTATPAQRRAIALRDRGCILPGCMIGPASCQIHHIIPWTQGGLTEMSNLASLCWAHHRQIEMGRYLLKPTSPETQPDAGVGTPKPIPANHGAPFTITPQPRNRWRC